MNYSKEKIAELQHAIDECLLSEDWRLVKMAEYLKEALEHIESQVDSTERLFLENRKGYGVVAISSLYALSLDDIKNGKNKGSRIWEVVPGEFLKSISKKKTRY